MGKKIIWLLVCCMMALSLVMASCGTAEEDTGKTGGEPVVEGNVGVSGPQYGGVLKTALATDYTGWDPYTTMDIRATHLMFTSNEYLQGDWTKGPNGTGETAWEIGFLGRIDLLTGELAESWEFPDSTTIILHIREGVHYQDKAPVNGRELTAEDAAWSIMMRFNNTGCWHNMAYPPGCGLEPSSATATDRYTVEVKVPAVSQEIMLLEITENGYCNAPEIWIGTGPGEGQGMDVWGKVVGSGPFELTDYVQGSFAKYTRFDNYWEYDPMYPENQWPYLDEFQHLFIPDLSTRLASLRTGKIDFLSQISHDDAMELQRFVGDKMESTKAIAPFARALGMRMDIPDMPEDELMVRQAMNMAVNKQDMIDNYYKGDAVLLGYPYAPTPTYSVYYKPLDEYSEDVQKLFTYDVEGAKQLLADAGYPDGFQTEVLCDATDADELSIIKAYLEDVNITLDLNIVEATNKTARINAREYRMAFNTLGIWAPFEMLTTKYGQVQCTRNTDDPFYKNIQLCVASNILSHPDTYIQCMRDSAEYELASAWAIFAPRPWQYTYWWPWVKDFNGIYWTGWAGVWDWTKSIWADQDLKTSMGY